MIIWALKQQVCDWGNNIFYEATRGLHLGLLQWILMSNFGHYTVHRAEMNSVTGESGPVNTDRPKPALSHEVLATSSGPAP